MPPPFAHRLRHRIRRALRRRVHEEVRRVDIRVDGPEVVLRGTVASWPDRDRIETAVWAAPGVARVHNRLTVSRIACRPSARRGPPTS
jgi:osmotically-inducible protein OsmY